MKSTIIIAIILAFITNSFSMESKESDLEKDELKGKVKVIIKSNNSYSQNDDITSKKLHSRIITKYNIEGNIVYTEYFENYISHLRKSKSRIIYAKYYYDEKGFRNKIIICEYDNCDTLSLKNDEHGNPIEFIHHYNDLTKGEPRSNRHLFDKKCQIIAQRIYGFFYFPKIIKYEYDDSENITVKYQYFNNDSLIGITRYKYDEKSIREEKLESDGSDNLKWTIKYDSNGTILTHSYFKNGNISGTRYYEPQYDNSNILIELKNGYDLLNYIVRYEYDKNSNVIKKSNFEKLNENGKTREVQWFESVIGYEYYD